MVLIGIAWIPVIRGSKGLYDYIQSVQGYLAPPIFVVFFLGVFWKRLNAAGCLAALVVGFLMGLFRLGVDTPAKIWSDYAYAEGSFLWVVNKIYFQYFSLLIFIVCSIVMIVVSYLTPAPDYERFRGLTFGGVSQEHKQATRDSWYARDVIASFVVIGLIVAAYLFFTG